MAALGVYLFQRNLPPNSGPVNPKANTQVIIEINQKIYFSTTFKLFYAKKGKTKNFWKGISSPKAFKIVLDAQSTTYEDFIEKVASESNERFASTGQLIRDATRTGVLPIEWHVYLLRSPSLPKFSKDSQYLITNQASFSHWIKAVAALCKDEVFAGLQLKMEIPGVVETRNACSSRRRNQGTSNKPNQDVSPSVFEDSVNLYLEKLYEEHLPNKKDDNQFPVFIDPCNSNRYILLTIGAMQIWAHSLVSRTLFFFFFRIH
ncbi:hypothetical protein VP01_1981g4 [Puccinia sorghi]|uniref:Uncharacterized protein n=1 Tax=Puccinia sorghi TaxID=27349 RepID=A0A0L6VDI4_9BASI|nr:hypothetical protein VP01_1981g4 [Puccinia sorghi]